MSQRYWDPSHRLLATIRSYQSSRTRLFRGLAVIRHHFWSAVSGAEIPLNSKIDESVRFPHPNGVVIHPDAHISNGCIIMQQVTIGVKSGTGDDVPHLESGVEVGAGAKILGPITIGANSVIGANAVVIHSVPPGSIVVGIPARIIGNINPITQRREGVGK
jgi:serine O-acetyltransferase